MGVYVLDWWINLLSRNHCFDFYNEVVFMHIKLLENSIVDFLSFYNYNLIHKTKINANNSLIFADTQFGTSAKMLMSYPSIVYIISLYHSSKNDKVVSNKFIPTNSYISIEDIEKLKHTNLEKIDYLVIVERTDSTISDIDTLMKNILFVSNKSNKISYNIATAEAKAAYSSLDDKITYEGDSSVVVDREKINIQIHCITAGYKGKQ